MPLIRPFRVQVDVQAWTPTGSYHHTDLMGNLKTIRTQKTTIQSYDTFTLTFTMQEDSQGSWADKLPYRTYVEIRAGVQTPGVPPILMRGFVESPGQVLSMPSSPNGPAREVVVTGRDMGTILTDWQILYLWGIDPMSTFLAASNSYVGGALNANLGIDGTLTSPPKIIQAFFDQMVAGAVKNLQAMVSSSIPNITPIITLPAAYQMNLVALQPWQGSWSNFLDYFTSPPWGESFIFDAPNAPQFILRQTPYKEFTTGTYPLPFGNLGDNGFFADVSLNAGDLTGHNLMINGGSQLYTYYLTIPDLSSTQAKTNATWYYVTSAGAHINAPSATSKDTNPAYSTSIAEVRQAGSNPYYDVERAKLWGIRPLQLTTPWIAVINQIGTTIPALMNTWLVNVFQHNDRLVSGTITCHGREDLTVGRYVVIQPGTITTDPTPWEAYIESVSHDINLYSNNATWQTTLGVVRGRVRTKGEG